MYPADTPKGRRLRLVVLAVSWEGKSRRDSFKKLSFERDHKEVLGGGGSNELGVACFLKRGDLYMFKRIEGWGCSFCKGKGLA